MAKTDTSKVLQSHAPQPASQQVQHGSASRYAVTDDRSSLTVRNVSADGSPARANTQTRSGTITSY
jgi:hypothetical protein